mmetsp:Transcript_25647/g.29599  ORF Transcript_25647/g.29599 Transcript_25647/m.29599 type:complete len:346 (+) Transcript_25647:267-1304(+)
MIYCHDAANDTRIQSKKLEIVEQAPHTHCLSYVKKKVNTTKVASMIHDSYGGSAEQLMIVMCDSDQVVREKALEDMRIMNHARSSISDWLSFLEEGVASGDKSLALMVLEAGYDFESQINGAVVVALANSKAFNGTLQTARTIVSKKMKALKVRRKGEARNPYNQNIHSSNHALDAGLSSSPWVKQMQVHQAKGISDEAACYLASTFYREDYSKWLDLIDDKNARGNTNGTIGATTFLGELGFHGPAEGVCKEALVAICMRLSKRDCSDPKRFRTRDVGYHGRMKSTKDLYSKYKITQEKSEVSPSLVVDGFEHSSLLSFLCWMALGVLLWAKFGKYHTKKVRRI